MYIISSNAITEGAASLSTEEERGFICDLQLQAQDAFYLLPITFCMYVVDKRNIITFFQYFLKMHFLICVKPHQ